MASRTFGWKKQQQRKNESFFRLNFNVYINVENKERARASRTKNSGEQFRWKKKNETYMAVVRKWEMIAVTKVKMSCIEQEHKRTAFPSQNV